MIKNVIVTGGAGFIGSHLVDLLINEGMNVFVIDNLSTGEKNNINPKATFLNLDIRNLEAIKPVFKNIDAVFHLAAIASVQYSIENPKETNDINVGGILNVLLAAKDSGVKKFIFSSSSSVYGDADKIPTEESCKINPKSPYALHKYTGELYCKLFSDLYGLETVCFRYFNVYGPRQNPNGAYASVIAKFSNCKKTGDVLKITGDGNQTRDFVFVEDVARANLLAAKSEMVWNGEVINIGSGKKYSVNEIAKIIGGPTINIPPRIEPKDSLADIKLAKFLLIWEPQVSLDEGLKKLLSGSEF